MDNNNTNPLFVALFFVLRCVVPLFLMLGVSYLLKRLGLIAEAPPPPLDYEDNNTNSHNGGQAHGHA